MGSTCVWALDAHEAVLAAEIAEVSLSYSSECKSESKRKSAGAYYTPADVADHFWKIFFARRGINTTRAAEMLLNEAHFVEPSVGAGALFFSLIEKLLQHGLSPTSICSINVDLIDINGLALDFVRDQIKELERRWSVKFEGVNLIHGDFRSYEMTSMKRLVIFFGNPPFVSNEKGASKWKNLYADFVERSLDIPKGEAHLHFILPLSIAFSRDYRELRLRLRNLPAEVSVSNYDNIPDTLFKSGKPKNTNTNKANSQRCSILSVVPARMSRLYSSSLQRWARGERTSVLSSLPVFYDVTDYRLDDQFPRPASQLIADYLLSSSESKPLGKLVGGSSQYQLIVASVARNYIGIRDDADGSCNILNFRREEDFLTALGVVTSRLFFEYWLTLGDGFHLTRSTILNFPITDDLEEKIRLLHPTIGKFWRNRRHFEKMKLNNGKQTRSFDFSSVAPSLHFERPCSRI